VGTIGMQRLFPFVKVMDPYFRIFKILGLNIVCRRMDAWRLPHVENDPECSP